MIAAQALNGAGQEAEGATALLEAALAVYDAAPSDMMAAGLDPEVMEALRAALQTGGENPDGFAAVVAEADTSLGAIQARGAEAREVIGFLVRLCAETFDAGVASGQIRRPLDYQTSYGLAVLALETASGLDPEADRALITELRMLVMMWPAAGPVATSVPAPDAQMVEQFLRIRSALAG
ncbi:hypothetical protein [Hyphomonas sp.]|uniref:hypothetical protein n=1 Tax=Hyphomonas sp. TaxID=87 RepID=UPI00391BBF58